MASTVHIPSPAADRPRAWSVVAAGVLGLIAGLSLARWAAADVVVGDEATFASSQQEVEGELAAVGDGEVEGESEVAGEVEGEREGEVEGEGEGEVAGEGEGEVAGEVEVESEVASTPTSTAPAATAPARPIPSGPVTIRHGRVAVLRCDGAPQQAGPFPCPRDEALEISVWQAIDTLPACAAPPPPGAADLVIDFDRTVGPAAVLRARDTFRDDVARSDGEAIVTCLTPALANLASPIPGERLMFSFRFVVE